jgi:hypothetical protein
MNTVRCFPFQDFEDDFLCDLESEEVFEESLDVLITSCYDKDNDMVDNIDDFIHAVGPWVWIKKESEEKGKEKTKCELRGRHID